MKEKMLQFLIILARTAGLVPCLKCGVGLAYNRLNDSMIPEKCPKELTLEFHVCDPS